MLSENCVEKALMHDLRRVGLDEFNYFHLLKEVIWSKYNSPSSFVRVEIQLMCNHSENAMIYVLNAVNGRTDLNINQFTMKTVLFKKNARIQIVRFVNLALYTQSNKKR